MKGVLLPEQKIGEFLAFFHQKNYLSDKFF